MKPYKPTGNLAMDMVAACINHFEQQNKKVKVIYLKDRYWVSFTDYVKWSDVEYKFNHEVDFDGTMVRKASIFQGKALYYELEIALANV